MEYKKISEKDFVNVKKYWYGCRFEDSFLNSICDDIADFDVCYHWLKDTWRADKDVAFGIGVRHKETLVACGGYIKGEPTDEKVVETILKYINGIKLHIASKEPHGDPKVGFDKWKEKRQIYWL
jgi:hypothetical protein